MRKFFTLLTMLLLASSAWATEVVFDATVDLGTGSSTAGAFFIEKEGVKIDVAQGVANGTHYRFYKNQLVTVTSTIGDIIKIEFTCVANDEAQYGPAGFGSVNPGEYSYSGKIGTWTGSSSNVILTPSVGQVRATKVVVTVGQAGLVPPVIKPTAGTYYDPIQVEITCSTPGAKIYYTTNGSNPSTSSTQYTAPFTLSNNTTVKAISYFNGETSEVVTADYVFSTATVVNNIAAYSAMADETVVKFNNSVTVLAQHNKYLYVKDNSGYGLFFGTTGQTYQTGDVIPAGFTGKKTTYSGEPELADLSNFQPASGHVNVTPETINPNQLGHNMWAHYVYLENVQIDPETKILTDANGNTAPVYFSMGVTAGQVTAGTTYKVWAIVGAYKPADGDVVYQLLPIKVEGEPPIPQDAVALCELGDIADNTVVTIKNDAIVLGQKGYYLYLKDTECGYGLAYGDCGQTYEPGDVIPAGYGGTKTTYDMEPELKTLTGFQPKKDNIGGQAKLEQMAETITLSQVGHDTWGHYVLIKNLKIDTQNKTFTDANGNTIGYYDRFGIAWPDDLNESYDVYAIVGSYKTNYQLLPTRIVFTPPVITVECFSDLYQYNQGVIATFTKPLTAIFQFGPNLYLKDKCGDYSLAYGNVAGTFTNGDFINDAQASWTTYQNAKQLSPVADTFVKAGHGAPVEPEIMPIEEVSQDMIHWYLGFENVDIIQEGDDFFIKDETGQIKLYDKFNIGITTAEDTYVEGFLTVYKGELELYPILIGGPVIPDNPFDVNKDGEVNISDINMVIDSILRGGTIGDVNGDGEVNISDISGIIDYMITH
jgi:hypothetical protein